MREMAVSLRNIRFSILRNSVIAGPEVCRNASSSSDYPEEFKQSPVYRKSRFDWLFGEGYRRPLAMDQGGKMLEFAGLFFPSAGSGRRKSSGSVALFRDFPLLCCWTAGKKASHLSESLLQRRGWLAYGFHPTDEYLDWKHTHTTLFGAIGIAFCGLVFYLIYKPDWPQMREWAFREAYLELERREKAGLPPISKDVIDPEKVKMVLPSDEELGDFEIVI
ncbi:hypothetical protein M514_05295 [Trichuris suis]|uniref:NADH dehydrogenase [ubiquinone] 1 beta subcomplex subunit 11, mitochondrial n=1 Tax=Trichuris suis TaxID=68888 RepID=A0A085NQ38_9BILA|nr:hypothetical protein M513_05295 [Trichuris suis]KFD71584.1 hypothetical protein M514_05295 [Trichuris suis]